MACVLDGKVDAIVLTGGLMRFDDVYQMINKKCSWIAPIKVYQGEYEQEALAINAFKVLNGKQKAKVYSGKSIWDGFYD